MDHGEAVRSQTAEKYLLGELQGAERDKFEDHFFECEECAQAVQTGVLFMDNAAAEFSPRTARAAASEKPKAEAFWKKWFQFSWRQPAFVLPVLVLVAVSGLWVADHEHLSGELSKAAEPQVFAEVQLDQTRGEKGVTVSRNNNYFAVAFDIDEDPSQAGDPSLAYVIEISGDGVAAATVNAPRHDGRYHILLPSSRYKPGQYQITVKSGPGKYGRFVQRFPLSIR